MKIRIVISQRLHIQVQISTNWSLCLTSFSTGLLNSTYLQKDLQPQTFVIGFKSLIFKKRLEPETFKDL